MSFGSDESKQGWFRSGKYSQVCLTNLKGTIIPVITKLTVTGRKDQAFVKTRSKF